MPGEPTQQLYRESQGILYCLSAALSYRIIVQTVPYVQSNVMSGSKYPIPFV
jgi:hypothetical protein